MFMIDRSKHHMRSPKHSSYYLASAGSWQFSEIKYPGTSGIVPVLFFLSQTIGCENKLSKQPKDLVVPRIVVYSVVTQPHDDHDIECRHSVMI